MVPGVCFRLSFKVPVKESRTGSFSGEMTLSSQ